MGRVQSNYNMTITILQENIKILQALEKHKSDVTCCDFAPNFVLVTGSSDKTVRVWKWLPESGYVENAYSPLNGHKYGVTCVRVSPQGSMLASTSIDGTAVLWNLHSGTKIYTMVQMNGDAIRVCRFAPDSSVLITAGDNGAICIWDLVHRNLVRTIFHHQGTTSSLAFTPDSQYLISACSLEIIRVWYLQDLLDTVSDNTFSSLAVVDNAHDLGVLCIDVSSVISTDEFDPFTKCYTLATSGNSHDIKIWQITSATTPKDKSTPNQVTVEHVGSYIGHKSAVTTVKYNTNGMYLISASLDKYVKIWDTNGACIATLKGHTRYVNCVSFSRDFSLIASGSAGSNDKTVLIWDITGLLSLDSTLVKPLAQIGNALHNLQEMQVVQSAESSETFELIEKIDDVSEGAINSCHFSGNNLLATGSSDKMVRLLNIEEGNIEETNASPLDGHTYCVNHVEFSRDGTMLATCSLDCSTIIWNPSTGERMLDIAESSLAIRDCRFSPDSSLLVTVGDDEKASIWNTKTGELVVFFEGHTDAVTSTCFSPDGQIIATASSNADFRLWSLSGDNIYVQDDAHDLGIQNCEFSQNLEPMPVPAGGGKQNYLLATCGNDSLVKLWKVSVDKSQDEYNFENTQVKVWRTLQGHGGTVISVRFSVQYGEIVCSTATDRQARLWSIYSGDCLHVLDHDSIVTCCSFNADCTILATGCLDKTLWLWKLPQQTIVRNTLINKFIERRRQPIMKWTTEEVVKWLADIGFDEIIPNVTNTKLDGQKIISMSEDRICSGLDLGEEFTEKFIQELKWLKLDELKPNLTESQTMETPNEYLCPITQEIMREPVICNDGFTYEKQAITEWFMSGKLTSPMTNVTLTNTDFKINQELRHAIHTFLYNDT